MNLVLSMTDIRIRCASARLLGGITILMVA
jgi:hypothetical protein